MAGDTNLFTTENIQPGLERTPTVLILDTSGSMQTVVKDSNGKVRPRIDQLNDGLQLFKDEIESMSDVEREIDVALITFGGDVQVHQDFTPITDWEPPVLSEGGKTPMGAAIQKTSELIESRKKEYKRDGVPYKRPLVWVLTDGRPTDMKPGSSKWENVKQKIDTAENQNQFNLFIMTIGSDADTEIVEQLHPRTMALKDGKFEEFFEFLSNSVKTASSTEKGGNVDLSEDAKDFEEMFQL